MERARRKESLRMVKPGPSDVKYFLSTGSTGLDLCISGRVDPAGKGGIPAGRITEFYGPEASGKSFISGELCGSAQTQGWEQHMVDIERAFEFERSNIFALDTEHEDFYYYPNEKEPDVRLAEDLFGKYAVGTGKEVKYGLVNRIAQKLGKGKKAVVVIDSIAVVSTRLEEKGKDKHGASRAKMFSTGLRQVIGDISDKHLALVFDNQLRDSFNVSFGPTTDSPGGWAIKHYASIRVRLTPIGKIKENDEIVGIKIRCQVVKNKIDVPFRGCEISLYFDYGINDLRDCSEWLKKNTEMLTVKQGIYQLQGRKPVRGLDNFVQYVEDNDLEIELTNLMREQWQKLNLPERKRKPRKRV